MAKSRKLDNREKTKIGKIYYICGTDWNWEPIGDIVFYPTIKALKKERKCWIQCGIIKVTMLPKVIRKEDYEIN